MITHQTILENTQANILKSMGTENISLTFFKFNDFAQVKERLEWIKNLYGIITSAQLQIDEDQKSKNNKAFIKKPVICFYLSSLGIQELSGLGKKLKPYFSSKEDLLAKQKRFPPQKPITVSHRKAQVFFSINNKKRYLNKSLFPRKYHHPYKAPKLSTLSINSVPTFRDHSPSNFLLRELEFAGDIYREETHKDLNDPPLGEWQDRNYQKDWHGMIIVGHSIENELIKKEQEIIASLHKNKLGEILFIERGHKLYGRFGKERKKYPIEPFGYRDGITKMDFFPNKKDPFEVDIEKCKIVLDEFNGSFLVYRKLEQNVELFNQKVKQLSDLLNLDEKKIEAQIMGRYKDGTPLILKGLEKSKDWQPTLESIDKFNSNFYSLQFSDDLSTFEKDADGLICPFHAHIRKVNPRTKNSSLEGSHKINIPIIRRSVPYKYEDSTGLLFMCFQKDIGNQFGKIQKVWCNDNTDYEENENAKGLDPIAGNENQNAGTSQQSWLMFDEEKKIIKKNFQSNFGSFVKFRGGGYFYAPPITFFKNPEFFLLKTLKISS